MNVETFEVTIQLDSGSIDMEVVCEKGATQEDIFDAALVDLEAQLKTAKLGYWRRTA